MVEYWQDHSKDGSLEEMMLDNNAATVAEEELPEILSYIPDVTGKDVVELGAGIGSVNIYRIKYMYVHYMQ